MANTGGLLGLCMGFSLVSAFEILYHILISFCKYFEKTISTNLDKLKPRMKSLPPPSPSQTTTTSQVIISNLNYTKDLGVKDNSWLCSVFAQTEALIPDLPTWSDL